MKNITLSINPYSPPVQHSPFNPPLDKRDINLSFGCQFKEEALAMSFASDLLKLIDQYRK